MGNEEQVRRWAVRSQVAGRQEGLGLRGSGRVWNDKSVNDSWRGRRRMNE